MSTVLTPLVTRYIDGDRWLLEWPFSAISDLVGPITVPTGAVTDFNSVPRVFTNILPREEYGEAAVLHDWLYQMASTGTRPVTRVEADQVHREFLRWKGAPGWKVHVMYGLLRLFGGKAWDEHRAEQSAVRT